jgi:hypothetical protein
MESGKHVYSAVPVIWMPDAEEVLDWCDKLVRTCVRTGRHYMLGETTFFRPETMYCRRRAAEGAFGDFVYAEGEYFHPHDWSRADLRSVKQTVSRAPRAEWAAIRQLRCPGCSLHPMTYPPTRPRAPSP